MTPVSTKSGGPGEPRSTDERAVGEAIKVGNEPAILHEAKAVFAGAQALEITDAAERDRAWQLLDARHPNLRAFELPDSSDAAVMRAKSRHVSVGDYSKGLGHTDEFTAADAPAT